AFKETDDEVWLEYTMNCFLQAIKFGIPTSRSHLARVQYLISSDTPNEPVGGQTLEKKSVCFLSPSQPPPPIIHHLSRHLPPLSRYHSPPSRRRPPFSTAIKRLQNTTVVAEFVGLFLCMLRAAKRQYSC
nr:transformation/transcription domain-associated protein-like isoform X2 [Tanacetum cinerariifolium]